MKPKPPPKPKVELAKIEDVPALVQLINSAYRGESGKIGWTTESDLLGGQRIAEAELREIMEHESSTVLLVRSEGAELLGCVLVKKLNAETAYLGMLTVNVNKQTSGIGKFLVSATEFFASTSIGATTIEMTVIAQRPELISWYERRGYEKTGEHRPFPYGDERFGIPLRPDLYFEVLTKSI